MRGLGDDGAGREYRVRARPAEGCEVLGRDDAADDDHRSVKTELTKRCFQSRDERKVACGKRRDAHDMNLPFGRTRRDFLRRCKQRSDLDVESEIRERRGDDLLPAIMPVLSHLGDQYPRRAAFVLGEGAGHRDHTFVGLHVRPRLPRDRRPR